MKNSYIQSSKESAGLSFKYLNAGILWRIWESPEGRGGRERKATLRKEKGKGGKTKTLSFHADGIGERREEEASKVILPRLFPPLSPCPFGPAQDISSVKLEQEEEEVEVVVGRGEGFYEE